jgi:lipoprotein Spr
MTNIKCYIITFVFLLLLGACGTQNSLIFHENNPDPIPNQLIAQTSPLLVPSCSTNVFSFSNGLRVPAMSNILIEERLGINIEKGDDLQLLQELASWVGVPYKHANNDKSGTDCSGLSFAVFKRLYNKSLERSSDGQFFKNCKQINRKTLKMGDLLFFAINKKQIISHVGIYLKNDKFIHASSVRGVVVSDLNDDYYSKYFYAAGRVK